MGNSLYVGRTASQDINNRDFSRQNGTELPKPNETDGSTYMSTIGWWFTRNNESGPEFGNVAEGHEDSESDIPPTSTGMPSEQDAKNRDKAIADTIREVLAYQSGEKGSVTFEEAKAEIHNGRKVSHWIWYVFPQAYPSNSEIGLACTIPQKYCLDIDDAILDNETLADNFVDIYNELQQHHGQLTIREIFGHDDVKVRSCLTLFSKTRGNRKGKAESVLALESFFTDECEDTNGYFRTHYPGHL